VSLIDVGRQGNLLDVVVELLANLVVVEAEVPQDVPPCNCTRNRRNQVDAVCDPQLQTHFCLFIHFLSYKDEQNHRYNVGDSQHDVADDNLDPEGFCSFLELRVRVNSTDQEQR
jgi:hypothetical protein